MTDNSRTNNKEEADMITVNLYYKGSSGSARAFAEEMESSGIAADIRAEKAIFTISISNRWTIRKQSC